MWTAAIPFMLQSLPGFIQAAEALFSHKPKSGTDKKAAVVSMVQTGLQLAGHLPIASSAANVVSAIGSLVDLNVAAMQQAGVLPTSTTPTPPAQAPSS